MNPTVRSPGDTKGASTLCEGQSSELAGRVCRSAFFLTAGGVASYGLSFLRNIFLARLLTKTDFGVAALLANTLAMLEVSGRLSLGQHIVQSSQGGLTSFRDTAHTLQAIAGGCGAVLVCLFGVIAAQWVEPPGLAWAFAVLAVVPLLRGLENLDMFREQKRFNQRPVLLHDLIPQVVVTILVVPLALWFRDFRVVVWVIVMKATVALVVTHGLANERYAMRWNRRFSPAMFAFGLPLLANGLLVFVSQQADQYLVAGAVSTEQLAGYALAFSLVSVPWAILSVAIHSALLPALAHAREDRAKFLEVYRGCVEVASLTAIVTLLPLIIVGEQVVVFLYGTKYAGTGQVTALLGVAAALRFVRLAPGLASMAMADTRNHLVSNVVRACSFPLAAAGAIAGGATWIAASAVIGEAAAGVTSALRLSRRQRVPLLETLRGAIYVGVFVGLGLLCHWLGAGAWPPLVAAGSVLGVLLIVSATAWATFATTRRLCTRIAFVVLEALQTGTRLIRNWGRSFSAAGNP
jgi:O-antigen/teichoic acid export membrane protein